MSEPGNQDLNKTVARQALLAWACAQLIVVGVGVYVPHASIEAMYLGTALGGIGIVLFAWLSAFRPPSPRQNPPSARIRITLIAVLIIAVAALIALIVTGHANGRDFESWPITFTVILVYQIYLQRLRRTERVAGDGWPSLETTARHLIGYLIAVAGSLVAASLALDRLGFGVALLSYPIVFALTKLACDQLFAPPIRLIPSRLSTLLRNMTVISPFWWGLPWGLANYAFQVLLDAPHTRHLEWALIRNLPELYHVAIAAVLACAALTLIAALIETLTFRPGNEPTSNRDLAFYLVTTLAMASFALAYEPWWSLADSFGKEKWTCAEEGDEAGRIGWISDSGGVDIFISAPTELEFFALTCMPNAEADTCWVEGGWDRVSVTINSPSGVQTLSFDRDTPGILGTAMHHAHLTGDLARSFIDAFRNGTSADISVYHAQRGLLYARHVDLKGFSRALDICAARWRRP